MAETAQMNSQLPTSYLTFYTLWGLSRRYLALIRGDLTIAPIINDVGLVVFCAKLDAKNLRSTASLAPHCGRSAQRITAIFAVLSTMVVTERRTASRSHVGFTMRSLEGAVCNGGTRLRTAVVTTFAMFDASLRKI